MERIIRNVVIVACVVIIIVVNVDTFKGIKDVKDNYAFTEGKIVRYFHIGAAAVMYVEYSYSVTGITYSRTLLDRHYPECERNLSLCEGKRFWVAYSKVNNDKSLINLNVEIQNIKDPMPPESLEGFE